MKVFLHITLIILLLSCYSCKKESNNYHSLPIVKINAPNEQLFSDSLGIYVVGIGRAENWQGMKANYFEGRKITANIEYIVNGESKLEQNADLKVSGGGSRKWPQKSFNVYAEKKYGKSRFNYPFFHDLDIEEFNTIRLRNSGQDWDKTHLRDALMHTLTRKMNVFGQAYQPVVVYLNEQYWGIYNLREKFNKTYIRNHCNIDRSIKLDILERNVHVESGNDKEYKKLLKFLNERTLSNNDNYQSFINMIDIDNLIDYYCAQIYFANTDWPGNNIKYWRPRTSDGKWKWFMHDTDLGFGRAPLFGHPGGVEHNTLEFGLNNQETTLHNQPWATLILRKLMENDSFRNQFKTRFLELLKKDFSSATVIKTIDSLEAIIEPEIPLHIARWKDESDKLYKSVDEWKNNVEELRVFATKRPDIVRQHLEQIIPD